MKETVERERKLAVSSRYRLPNLPGTPLAPRRLTSVYWDTPDLRLARAGITLRRRTEARKGVWQLKLPHDAGRLELEFAGGPASPPDKLVALLYASLRGVTVRPMVTLRTRRAGWRVQWEETPIAEVVIDAVSVLDGCQGISRFRELEIELLEGDAQDLQRLEKVLRLAGAGDHDGRPKFFRALGLKLPAPTTVVPDSAPPVEHVLASLRARVGVLLRHDPGTRLGQDPEELHQMRVATRRLRAILRAARAMFVPEWVNGLRQELAWLGSALGPVRDRDVLLEHFHEEARTLVPEDRRAFDRLLGRLNLERKAARGQMMEVLRSDRYLKLLERLEQAVETPALVTEHLSLVDLAASEFRKLRKAIRGLSAEPTDQDLHRIRIRCKRARYAAELAEGVVGKPASRFVKRAKVLQDLLGEHQDAVVAEERLCKLVETSRSQRAAFAAGQLMERQRARRASARGEFRRTWSRLRISGRMAWS